MDFNRRIALLFVTLGSLFPRLVAAQGADSAMFHRGQWGADFIIGNGFFGAGALRFTNPGHAWLVDVGANYQHTSGTTNGANNSGNSETFTVEVGSRSYHAMNRRLYGLTTVGASFNYGRSSINGGPIGRSSGGSLFGDLGAAWFVTPHLGVGARWRAALSYLHLHTTFAGNETTLNAVGLSLGTVVLTGQLTF